MELRALFLLPLCFPGQAPEAYRRREGDTLYIQCPYTAWTTGQQQKYWCLFQGNEGCQEVPRLYSYEETRQSQDGRIKIKDNKASKTVSVTMSGLKAEDSGTYFCATYSYNRGTYEQLRTISLIVFRELLQWELDTLTVQCPIADYSTVSKAWCKMEEGETCKVLVTTRPESPAANSTAQERVRIQDDTQQGIVTVTMEQLQVQDSGVYWCVLQDVSGLLRMEEITLNISKGEYWYFYQYGRTGRNTFLILSVVLLILLLLALLSCTALAVRHYRLLLRTGTWGWRCPSSGRRESSQDGSKGPAYINLDVQSPSSPEDPLYCNVEPSQAPRNPQHVEYAIIAFNQAPRTSKE
uniref:Ig-like domain-containing protein n=1 Tax=Junco hyemalis TaxID=40217 RepID=A0A8C5JIT5_JUNHY